MPKFIFFALIDYLGGKLLEHYNFFEPLTQFYGLLRKATPFLCLFGTVNINEAVLPDKNDTFALLYYFGSCLKVY